MAKRNRCKWSLAVKPASDVRPILTSGCINDFGQIQCVRRNRRFEILQSFCLDETEAVTKFGRWWKAIRMVLQSPCPCVKWEENKTPSGDAFIRIPGTGADSWNITANKRHSICLHPFRIFEKWLNCRRPTSMSKPTKNSFASMCEGSIHLTANKNVITLSVGQEGEAPLWRPQSPFSCDYNGICAQDFAMAIQ
ncbi:hypothetical protein TcasGA2_TC003314 [Tribolium castaneum]|uniref:Uncharacterized protein n=1 Tax=Tribolium castaneum TaxID=7070 RepID=D6WEZ1_TRICA|nr:hypothetical protein TcasGA2_TC003314 [Tribolium castaneum]